MLAITASPARAQSDVGREIAEALAASQARFVEEEAQRQFIGPFEPRNDLERDILTAAQLDMEFRQLTAASMAGDETARERRRQIVDRLSAFDEQYQYLEAEGTRFRLQWMVLTGGLDTADPGNMIPSIRTLYQARYAERDARNRAQAAEFLAAQTAAAEQVARQNAAVATGPPPGGRAAQPPAATTAPAPAAQQPAAQPAESGSPPAEPDDESDRPAVAIFLDWAFLGLLAVGLVYAYVERRTGPPQSAADPSTLLSRLSQAPGLRRITDARNRIANATADLERIDREIGAAAVAAGQAIGEGLRHISAIEAEQQAHRAGAPARALMERTFGSLPVHLAAAFTTDAHAGVSVDQRAGWQDWQPAPQPMGLTAPDQPGVLLRWGSYDPRAADPLPFSALPLIGGGKPWVIVSGADEDAHDLLRALALRIACMLPQQSRFTFLDPLSYGQTFPLQRYLPAVRETGTDLAQDLQRIQADVRRILRDVVAFHGTFDALPAEQQAAERYEFIFAADFPKARAYDRRVTEMLFDIGRAGPKAGRYLILHVVEGQELPHGISFDQLGDAYRIDLTKEGRSPADRPPAPDLQQTLLERIRGAVPARRSAGLYDILPPVDAWWTGSAARRVEATLDGQKDGLQIVFGQRDEGTELVHGVLAASAGAGKSNLLHALVLGLAASYPPEELQLYLMDLKQGVEFQPYATLPHAAVVAYNTAPALARAVLSELRREMTRRYEGLFRPAGVQKLEDYRTAGEPHGPAPRVLLVIDEYQALFQGGDAHEVSADLLALSTQGRAAGIHMLLGSQTFRAVGMQGSEQIFNNINIRIAMRIPAAAAQALVEFDREGKEMIRELEGTGQVVVNTGAGRDGANRRGQVIFVPPDVRGRVLSDLAAVAARWPAEKRSRWPGTQVFDGSRAPSSASQPLAEAARVAGAPLDTQSLARWAAASKSAGGLGRADWRPSDAPVPLLLGREYAVYGHAACVLRRLPNQNLLLVGGSAPARLGMLKGIVSSALALAPDVVHSVRAIDLSGDPAVAAVLSAGGARIEVVTDRNAAVDAIGTAPSGGTDLLLVIEPDRALELLRPADPLARAAGPEALERRLREGPLAGRHTIVVLSAMAGLGRVLGRRGTNAFAWRAASQMSQEDSQDLLGNRAAAQLRDEGQAGPEAALLADIDGNRSTRFMPYGE